MAYSSYPGTEIDPKSLPITAGVPVEGRPLRYVDVETTGLGRGARIIEISIVDADGEILLDTLVNPMCQIPPVVQNLTGIRAPMVARAPSWAELSRKVSDLFAGAEVVAHNAVFERGRLANELVSAAAITCTLKMARQRYGAPLKLADAARLAGYTFQGNAHRSLPDTLAGRAVHRWLLTLPSKSAAAERRSERGQWQVVAGRRTWVTPQELHPTPKEYRPSRYKLCTDPADPRLRQLTHQGSRLAGLAAMSGRPWTESYDARLAALWLGEAPLSQILDEMQRTPSEVLARLVLLGLVSADHVQTAQNAGC